MTVHLAVLQHEPETSLGRFGELLADSAVQYEIVSTRRWLPDPLVFDAALSLGGSLAATDTSLLPTRRWIRNAVLSGLPYLGVCLGGQLLASALGARVRNLPLRPPTHYERRDEVVARPLAHAELRARPALRTDGTPKRAR